VLIIFFCLFLLLNTVWKVKLRKQEIFFCIACSTYFYVEDIVCTDSGIPVSVTVY